MKIIYNIFVFLYFTSIRIASVFNKKAKQWVDGRKKLLSRIKSDMLPGKQTIWVHCASLGEFEQGRPVIEQLRTDFPDHIIVLTFFSPSGFEVRKNYEFADFIYYLPADTRRNARKFIGYIRPQMVLFIKYEFWFNFIDELCRQKIPLIFVSVIFRSSQYFFQPWGRWFARQLNKVTYIFVQNEDSIELLDSIGIHHAEISGDTRFDRVIQLSKEHISFPIIEKFKGKSRLLIAGSTWQPDEKILLNAINNSAEDFKLLIAPHLIDKEHIAEIVKLFGNYSPILYSNASEQNITQNNVLIIDSIGMLSQIYYYADIAYIGGGFGVGIHNLLEASTHGIPVIFGPNYKRFGEAVDLANNGGGFSIINSDEFVKIFDNLMNDKKAYNKSMSIARQYVHGNAGATQMVVNRVKEYIIAG